jgi:hypothetical protein
MDRIDQTIEQANQGLTRVKIFRRGRELALRGPQEARGGEGQSANHYFPESLRQALVC